MSYREGGSGANAPQERRERESHYPPPPEVEGHARAYHQRVPSNNGAPLPPIAPNEHQYAQHQNGYPDPRGYQQEAYRAQPSPDPYQPLSYRTTPSTDQYQPNTYRTTPPTDQYPPPAYRTTPPTDQYPPAPYRTAPQADQYQPNSYRGAPSTVDQYQSNSYRAGPPTEYPQDAYREGPPQDARSYQPDYRQPPAPQFTQSAPRQRTAIACRYCRRRKIRCSGFEQNPKGQCGNCQRFAQECIFTPVSSQAQAFVPAHAVYPAMRNMGIGPDGRPHPMGTVPQGTQLYGAHGQPLSIPTTQAPPMGSPYQDYAMPSPTGSYNSYTDDRQMENSRKRAQPEPHPAILPPPVPGQPPYNRTDSAGRRAPAEPDLRLPPVTPNPQAQATSSNYSPDSSTSSHSTLQPPAQAGLPPLTRTPPPRSSPGEGRADPMALNNIMERRPDTEIDRSMLGRLSRKA